MMQNLKWTAVALVALTSIARADDAVNAALDALHASGDGLTSLAADVSLTETSSDTGDAKTRTGTFVLQRTADGDSRIRVTFDKVISGKRIDNDRRDILLQGPNLIDRDYKSKKQTTRQVRRPGEKVNLFKLGEGPFPLPVGQSRDDVLKEFDVKPLPNNDPAVMRVLELTPKAGTSLAKRFKTITVTVDAAKHLPSRVETVDPNETTTTTAVLTNLRVNADVKDLEFQMPALSGDWNLVDAAG